MSAVRAGYRPFLPASVGVLALLGAHRLLATPLVGAVEESPRPGADLFVTVPMALLRETPEPTSRILARLPVGTALTLSESKGASLLVRARSGAGFMARGSVAAFGQGPDASLEMATVARFLLQDENRRRLGIALLSRSVERLREGGAPDPRLEVALGEWAEALIKSESPAALPATLRYVEKTDPITGKTRAFYDGASFRAALEGSDLSPAVRERAEAGVLRSRYPFPSSTFVDLVHESADWLSIVDRGETPAAAVAGDRLGDAGLALGRLLLAAGKLDELSGLAERLSGAAEKLASLAPDSPAGARLRARARIVVAMRGNGKPLSPQVASLGSGPSPLAVKIEGEIGNLSLLVTPAGSERASRLDRAVPVLPVPGSLRVAPDGRSAAWLEVTSPTSIVPVVAHLDGKEGARDLTAVAGGRPSRDKKRGHLVASLDGYSADGRSLAMSVSAWDDEPPAKARTALVSTETGNLVAEGAAARSATRVKRARRGR